MVSMDDCDHFPPNAQSRYALLARCGLFDKISATRAQQLHCTQRAGGSYDRLGFDSITAVATLLEELNLLVRLLSVRFVGAEQGD